ncbi:hypothetical protein BS78_04G061100 [Paspalum vaginatum]|nr:hypothetical protein BS78_04G061100 [Paspalum vaginatum]
MRVDARSARAANLPSPPPRPTALGPPDPGSHVLEATQLPLLGVFFEYFAVSRVLEAGCSLFFPDPSSEAGSLLPSLIFFFGNNRFDCSRSDSFSVFRNPRGAMMNWDKQSLFGDVVYMIQN